MSEEYGRGKRIKKKPNYKQVNNGGRKKPSKEKQIPELVENLNDNDTDNSQIPGPSSALSDNPESPHSEDWDGKWTIRRVEKPQT